MKKNNFKGYIYNKIKDYLFDHNLEELSCQVYSMKVTEECGHKIIRYISGNKIGTFSQNRKNGKHVRFQYTANFSIKCYSSGCFIGNGTRGSLSDQEYRDRSKLCMTIREVYYGVLRKYPDQILDIELKSLLGEI